MNAGSSSHSAAHEQQNATCMRILGGPLSLEKNGRNIRLTIVSVLALLLLLSLLQLRVLRPESLLRLLLVADGEVDKDVGAAVADTAVAAAAPNAPLVAEAKTAIVAPDLQDAAVIVDAATAAAAFGDTLTAAHNNTSGSKPVGRMPPMGAFVRLALATNLERSNSTLQHQQQQLNSLGLKGPLDARYRAAGREHYDRKPSRGPYSLNLSGAETPQSSIGAARARAAPTGAAARIRTTSAAAAAEVEAKSAPGVEAKAAPAAEASSGAETAAAASTMKRSATGSSSSLASCPSGPPQKVPCFNSNSSSSSSSSCCSNSSNVSRQLPVAEGTCTPSSSVGTAGDGAAAAGAAAAGAAAVRGSTSSSSKAKGVVAPKGGKQLNPARFTDSYALQLSGLMIWCCCWYRYHRLPKCVVGEGHRLGIRSCVSLLEALQDCPCQVELSGLTAALLVEWKAAVAFEPPAVVIVGCVEQLSRFLINHRQQQPALVFVGCLYRPNAERRAAATAAGIPPTLGAAMRRKGGPSFARSGAAGSLLLEQQQQQLTDGSTAADAAAAGSNSSSSSWVEGSGFLEAATTLGPSDYDYYVHFLGLDRRLDCWRCWAELRETREELPPDQPTAEAVERDEEDEHAGLSREIYYFRVVGCGVDVNVLGLDEEYLREHEEATKLKTVERISIGSYLVDCWYFSPYPAEVQDVPVLFICEFCLSFFVYVECPQCPLSFLYFLLPPVLLTMVLVQAPLPLLSLQSLLLLPLMVLTHESELQRHARICECKHPPGNEIYRDDRVSMFEVDGMDCRVYCENLCFLSKLFLDHKTLRHPVNLFVFYVMTEYDSKGHHITGYFSKEKHSKNNLSCLLTLPQHQRKGYGKFLISFSYSLSKRERRAGGPERPLSDLGRASYFAYWTEQILTLLQPPRNRVSLQELSEATSIEVQDVLACLDKQGVLKVSGDCCFLLLPPEKVEALRSAIGRPSRKLQRPLLQLVRRVQLVQLAGQFMQEKRPMVLMGLLVPFLQQQLPAAGAASLAFHLSVCI
ncbi:hypothetical protein Emag_003241 [Eimeria magna]